VLVAQSMGGLIARCMMQEVFTFGTPHGGIVFQTGVLNWLEDVVVPAGSDIFAPEKMYGYLTPSRKFREKAPRDWDPQSIPPDVVDTNDVFCLIGTDSKDYGASKVVVGPKSGGLVRIDQAYVRNAHRAFVFKSHSGSYGEVTFEEGNQNLRRFLTRWRRTGPGSAAASLGGAGVRGGCDSRRKLTDRRARRSLSAANDPGLRHPGIIARRGRPTGCSPAPTTLTAPTIRTVGSWRQSSASPVSRLRAVTFRDRPLTGKPLCRRERRHHRRGVAA
jgi:hypothetical protein